MNNLIKKIITILTLGSLTIFVVGCTTTNPYTGEQTTSKTAAGAGIGAGVGALGGALIGSAAGGSDGALAGALIGAGVGGLAGAAIGNSMDQQDAELRKVLVGTGVQVKQNGNSVQLSMASDVTFATDSADIKASFYNTLNSVAIVLNKYNNTNITISGFTDSTGNDGHNQELSEHRAASVGAYLISQGIDPNRVFTKGFGSRYPVASNSTAQGRALNRRVVITLRPR